MNHKTEAKLIHLTQHLLEEYWKKKCEELLFYCAEQVLWIGAEQCEYIIGFEKVRANFEELMKVLQPCWLVNSEFDVVQNSGKACTIAGRYLVQTSEEAEYFLQAEQRCTFT